MILISLLIYCWNVSNISYKFEMTLKEITARQQKFTTVLWLDKISNYA